MLPVLIMNPAPRGQMAKRRRTTSSTRKRRSGTRRRRRRNPSIDTKALLVGALGALALAAGAYALDVTNLPRVAIGAIDLVAGNTVGVLVSMKAPNLGKGISLGGSAVGGYILIGEGMSMLSQPATTESNTQQNMNAVRPLHAVRNNMGAVVPGQLRASGLTPEKIANVFSAVQMRPR